MFVGATPQIWAQTAFSGGLSESKFRKENRIEFEKPIGDNNLFVPQMVRLVNALSSSVDFGWNDKIAFTIEELGFCESDFSPSYCGSGSVNDGVYKILSDYGIGIGREFAKRKAARGFGDIYSNQASFDFSVNGSVVSVKTTVHNKTSKEKDLFLAEINNYFATLSPSSTPLKAKVITDATTITSANDQIFVITRLPRGSLDILLSIDAK